VRRFVLRADFFGSEEAEKRLNVLK